MKVLFLSPYPLSPANDGGRRRIREIAEGLARRTELVAVYPPDPQGSDEPLPFETHTFGSDKLRRQVASPALAKLLRGLLTTWRFDVIWQEQVWNGATLALARVPNRPPIYLDAPDVLSVFPEQLQPPYRWLAPRYERWVARRASRVFVASEIDRGCFAAIGVEPGRITVLPNGVDTQHFRRDEVAGTAVREALVKGDEKLVLFFGQLGYMPNCEGLSLFAERVLPRLGQGYRLVVVGRGLDPALAGKLASVANVTVVGPVERMEDYINAADAVVSPLLHGTGTRLKILESISCGAPVVSTSVGAEGLDTATMPGLTVEDDWSRWPEAIELATRKAHERPSEAFRQQYDWGEIMARLDLTLP